MKLKSSKRVPYKGKVMDLQVQTDDHSYNVGGAVVHNSAAASIVLWFLGVTELDPILYSLPFERFMNKSRMPKLVV